MRARDLGVLAGAALIAVLVPLALAAQVQARLGQVCARWSSVLGAPVQVGDAEVDLSGALHLRRVRVGDAFSAQAIEAGVALPSLLAGRFRADEVQVERPRLRVRIDAEGRVDVAALVARARDARRTHGPAGAAGPPRRVLVTGGELVLSIEGRGEVRARGLELHPQAQGVRVVTPWLEASLRVGEWKIDATFPRTGLDVSLPELRVTRAALAGGELRVSAGGAAPLLLAKAVVTRDLEGVRIDGRVGDVSGPPVTAELRRGDGVTVARLAAEHLPLAPFAPALPAALDFGRASAGGQLRVRMDAQRVSVDGAIDVRGLVARHAVLAIEPVPLEGHLAGEASWERARRAGHARFEAQSGALRLGGEADVVVGEGRITSGRLALQVPELPCADAFAAVPLELRKSLDGLVLDGRIGGTARLAFDASGGTPTVFDVQLDNRCRVVEDAPAAAVESLRGPFAHALPGGGVRTLAERDPLFVPLAKLPKHVVGAFVAGEDARFFAHRGFDVEQMRRSFEVDMQSGRVERGGSTISQQLVKNLFLSRERTLARKLLEAVLTWRLETRVPKKRILEAYLNVIELGEGVYGVEPAAQRWFGKPAEKLTVAEAAFLAALTPAPVSSARKIAAAGSVDAETRARMEAVLRSMWRNHVIDAEKLRHAMHEQLELRP
jgi:Transglycosylase